MIGITATITAGWKTIVNCLVNLVRCKLYIRLTCLLSLHVMYRTTLHHTLLNLHHTLRDIFLLVRHTLLYITTCKDLIQ